MTTSYQPNPINESGLLAERPAPATVPGGYLYEARDVKSVAFLDIDPLTGIRSWVPMGTAASFSVLDLYVNSDTGLDTNDGLTALTPVLKIRRALEISTMGYGWLRINLAGTASHTDASTVNWSVYAIGRPIILVGAYVDNGLGLQMATAGSSTTLTATITPAVTLDQYVGSFIEFTGNATPSLTGVRVGISQNTTGAGPGAVMFTFDRVVASPAAGDTFNVVNPSQTIAVTSGPLFELSAPNCVVGATGVKLSSASFNAAVFIAQNGAVMQLDQCQLIGDGIGRGVVSVANGGKLSMFGLRSNAAAGIGLLAGLTGVTTGGNSSSAGSTGPLGGAIIGLDGGLIVGSYVNRGTGAGLCFSMTNMVECKMAFLDTNSKLAASDKCLLSISSPAVTLPSRIKGTLTGSGFSFGITLNKNSELTCANTIVDGTGGSCGGISADNGSSIIAASPGGGAPGLNAINNTALGGVVLANMSRLTAGLSTFSANAVGGVIASQGSYVNVNGTSVASSNTGSGISGDTGSTVILNGVVCASNTVNAVTINHKSSVQMTSVTGTLNTVLGVSLANSSSLSNVSGNTVTGANDCKVGANAAVAWGAVNGTADATLCQAAA